MFAPVTPNPPTSEGLTLRQLHPEPRMMSPRELLEPLHLAAQARADRPYTIANFVASADGRAAFRGQSRALSDPADREIFHGLREHVDAILVGTGTLRAERYGRLIPTPSAGAGAPGSGLAPEPLACIITRTGEVPFEAPLFRARSARGRVHGGGAGHRGLGHQGGRGPARPR